MSDDRTFEPTPKTLREARREGRVARSALLGPALALLAAGWALGEAGAAIVDAHAAGLGLAWSAIAGRSSAPPAAILEAALGLAAGAIAPVIAAIVGVAALSGLAQVGPLFAPRAIAPSLARLDPIAGLRALVSARRAVDLLIAVAAAAAVIVIAIATLREGLRGTLGLVERDPLAALRAIGALARTLVLRVGGALLAIAILDVVHQRWRWRRELRMTRREVEREREEAEGDPEVRRARERAREALAREATLEETRAADVIVLAGDRAVALRFDPEGTAAAPHVVARAPRARLLAIATEAGIPIVHDEPLGRALLGVDGEIPAALYEPVAQLLRAAWAERA